MFAPGIIIPIIPYGDGGYARRDGYAEQRQFQLLAISGRSEVVDYSQEVTLNHVFLNDTGCTCEASFKFPLERGCAVTRFSADVNGRHIEGKVEGKEKAEEMYDDAVASGSSVYMARQVEKDTTLEINLGNVEKDAEMVVSVSYLAELKVEEERISIAMGPKGNIPFSSTPVKTAGFINGFTYEVHVTSSTGISAEEAERTDYRCELNEARTEALYTIARGVKEYKPLDNLCISLAEPHRTTVVVQQFSEKDKNKFVALTLFPKIGGEIKTEMIFLIDCSGSMSGGLIKRAKDTLQFFLRSMQEGLLFNIVCFGSFYKTIFGRSVPYNDATLAKATAQVAHIQADMMGTNLYDPLEYVLSLPATEGFPRQVFIMTDGEVNNPDDCITLVRSNAHTTRVFTFGIGSGADAALCQDVAKAGNGACVMIKETKDMREMVMKQLSYALSPSISDITVEWDDTNIRQAPARIQPVFDGSILNIYALLPEGVRPGKHTATVLGRTEKDKDGERSFREVVEFNTEVIYPGNSVVKAAVKKLLDDLRDDKEAVSLSTKYGVLHKSTAFVAVGPILKDPSSGEVKLQKLAISRSTPQPSTVYHPRKPSASCMRYAAPKSKVKRDRPCRGEKRERRTSKQKHRVHYEVAPEIDDRDYSRDDDEMEEEDAEDEDYLMSMSYCDSYSGGASDSYYALEPMYEDAREPGSRTGDLDRIVLCQKANGIFGKEVLVLLRMPFDLVASNQPSVSGISKKEQLNLWITMVVLQYLETREAARKSEWEIVVRKSYKYLSSKLSSDVLASWKEAANALLSIL